MNDDLEPAPFDPPPDNAQLDIEQVIAERPPLDAILAQARQAPEINTEQLEVSADQLDAIRSQQSKRALEEARAAAAEIERQRLEVVAQEKLEEDQRPAENRIW